MTNLWNLMTSPEGMAAGALWVTVCAAFLVVALLFATREKKPAKPAEPTQFRHEWEMKRELNRLEGRE